ncbi:MAG: hypothetical protein IKT68_07770, partial [Clostridia bacterium]|nr:hypothetical protein [Clostridia bacterium]
MKKSLKSMIGLCIVFAMLLSSLLIPAVADTTLINLYTEAGAFAGHIDGAGNQVPGPGFITLAPVAVAQGDVITFG